MNLVRAIFFPKSGQGTPPPLPSSSYAPASYGKRSRNLTLEVQIVWKISAFYCYKQKYQNAKNS